MHVSPSPRTDRVPRCAAALLFVLISLAAAPAPGAVRLAQDDGRGFAGSSFRGGPAFFSARTRADGSLVLGVTLPGRDRRFRARVDPAGDIMRVRGTTLAGRRATYRAGDREALRRLVRDLKPSWHRGARASERLGRLLDFLVELAPVGFPIDIRYAKRELADPVTGAGSPALCTKISDGLWRALLKPAFIDNIPNLLAAGWFARRGWTYDSVTGEVCGLSFTPLCDRIGTIYADAEGFVTTQPMMAAGNLAEVPRPTVFYGGNRVPFGTIAPDAGTGGLAFCPGRCGPGCGAYGGDLLNATEFTFTAECFAHDACMGEVGGSPPTVGTGHACADEFLNASWGYFNGYACTASPQADVLGWWKVDQQYLYLDEVPVDGLGTLWSWAGGEYAPEGAYVVNAGAGGRWMHLRLDAFTPDRRHVAKIEAAPPLVSAGAMTQNNETAATSFNRKVFLGGRVVSAADGARVAGAAVTLRGDTLDSAERTFETDRRGDFLHAAASPHDRYEVRIEKEGYAALEVADVRAAPPEGYARTYELVPERFLFTTAGPLGDRIDWAIEGVAGAWEEASYPAARSVHYRYVPPPTGTTIRVSAWYRNASCCTEPDAWQRDALIFTGLERYADPECGEAVPLEVSRRFSPEGDPMIVLSYYGSCSGENGGVRTPFVSAVLRPAEGPR